MKTKNRGPVLLYLLVFIAVVGLDQWFKAWVVRNIPLYASPAEEIPFLPGIVHLTYIRNSGAAFGMLQNARWAFLALLAAFCVLVLWALITGKLSLGWERWLAVIAMAGAVGNGIDRALNGYVVDMFELEFMNFAVFNIADFAINVACILFVILMLLHKDTPKEKLEDTASEAETKE